MRFKFNMPRPSIHAIEHELYRVWTFLRKNVVLAVAFVAAVTTSIIIAPDKQYLGYIDFKTLACLFATLGVVCALKNIRFFTITARKIVQLSGSLRSCVIMLVLITFFGSMLIANDMALITFLPLGAYALSSSKQEKHMAYTFILQNIAANLGGMLTPFGNPQNLYLYNRFSIPTGEFMSIMLIPFLGATFLIIISCFLIRNEKIEITDDYPVTLDKKRTAMYLVLFAISILMVFRVVPYAVGIGVILVSLLILDRLALRQVDYSLLFTFVFFFIFAGNMARIDAVENLMRGLLEKDTLLFSACSCQVISNVPSSILLSQFTDNYRELLWGVNIGGTGTLIASLASLITFRTYTTQCPGKGLKYFGLFTLVNFIFLILLVTLMEFVK